MREADSRAVVDGAAFAELYQLHHQPLYRYCLSILRHEQDAQDALQNTMIKAHQALADDVRDLQMRPWLFRVAHNECISTMRRRRGTTELADDLPAAATTEERHAEREQLHQLERDLAQLPERQRSALVLRELSGLSHDEIGAVLGVTPAVVKSTIFEARSALLQFRDGRDMSCTVVREALSDGDKRVLRGRRQRAHLRDCGGCRAFRDALLARPNQLAALAPPLPAVAAAAMLHQLLGAGAAGSLAAFGAGSAGSVAATGAVAGSGSAGVAATAATTSVLGGVTAKVAVTAAVAALAIGGTATIESVRPSHDDGAAPAARSGASSSKASAKSSLDGGAASVSRRGAVGAAAGAAGSKLTAGRAGGGAGTAQGGALAPGRGRTQVTGSGTGASKRPVSAGSSGSATKAKAPAAGAKGPSASAEAKALQTAAKRAKAAAPAKPVTSSSTVGSKPPAPRVTQPTGSTKERPVVGQRTVLPDAADSATGVSPPTGTHPAPTR
jgi:RNA polymerase sigma factor (sigma-70 family)